MFRSFKTIIRDFLIYFLATLPGWEAYELLNISAFVELTVNSLPGVVKLYKWKLFGYK